MMFCIAFHLFPKPPRHFSMALESIRLQQDTLGLEGPDGMRAPEVSGNSHRALESTSPLSRIYSNPELEGRNGRPALHQTESESRKNLGSLTKKRRRRDSFGLEVRPDGTLSLDQLVEVASSEGARTRANGRRRTSGRRSLDHGSSSPQSRIRRRDSFGLEVRPDGTLSLDRLLTNTSDGGETSHNHWSRPQSPSVDQAASSNPLYSPNSRRYSGPNRAIPSDSSRRGVMGPSSSAHREAFNQRRSSAGPMVNNRSEVEVLRERVRLLETELALRGRPPTPNSVDAPPAYEPRRGSDRHEQRGAGDMA
ncbi:hypothetical protein NP233_g5259 [Leucocoprinus birnbaumii]|uniref:Uncharacterized protein n=1 Tax=Leucocoprinus birnbaumii TaxID=56174 RepID=A0AAD5VUL3_9AGAR|nr:hypothetical protein NP233_g5259 [Leucocoprinus birnbaumii]